MQWQSCPTNPLSWFAWREVMLTVLLTPALLLPLAGCVALLLAWWLQLPRQAAFSLTLLTPLTLSIFYSSAATALLSGWLLAQLPPAPPPPTALPVAVLVGRGPEVAAASTKVAAERLRQGEAAAIYVSGDARSTAEQLLTLGADPDMVAGDSCARTTWENAIITAAWLGQHHPGAPVLLITDPWQLARATHAFNHQGLAVQPLMAEPAISASARNRLALRETAATLLYWAQGRM
jgi:uncharacterized SAM-binding protein YcdF (DUF218 family)